MPAFWITKGDSDAGHMWPELLWLPAAHIRSAFSQVAQKARDPAPILVVLRTGSSPRSPYLWRNKVQTRTSPKRWPPAKMRESSAGLQEREATDPSDLNLCFQNIRTSACIFLVGMASSTFFRYGLSSNTGRLSPAAVPPPAP